MRRSWNKAQSAVSQGENRHRFQLALKHLRGKCQQNEQEQFKNNLIYYDIDNSKQVANGIGLFCQEY